MKKKLIEYFHSTLYDHQTTNQSPRPNHARPKTYAHHLGLATVGHQKIVEAQKPIQGPRYSMHNNGNRTWSLIEGDVTTIGDEEHQQQYIGHQAAREQTRACTQQRNEDERQPRHHAQQKNLQQRPPWNKRHRQPWQGPQVSSTACPRERTENIRPNSATEHNRGPAEGPIGPTTLATATTHSTPKMHESWPCPTPSFIINAMPCGGPLHHTTTQRSSQNQPITKA